MSTGLTLTKALLPYVCLSLQWGRERKVGREGGSGGCMLLPETTGKSNGSQIDFTAQSYPRLDSCRMRHQLIFICNDGSHHLKTISTDPKEGQLNELGRNTAILA